MSPSNPNDYPPAIAELLREPWTMPLGVGPLSPDVRTRLGSLSNAALFAPHPIRDEGMANACRAGLWLYHNFLDESHQISQKLNTQEGSYWHGLMHLREPDFSNAAYWFRRVGAHPIHAPLCQAAKELAADAPPAAAFLRTQSAWDPFAFVDLCASALVSQVDCAELCLRIGKRQWELLFDWCYRKTID